MAQRGLVILLSAFLLSACGDSDAPLDAVDGASDVTNVDTHTVDTTPPPLPDDPFPEEAIFDAAGTCVTVRLANDASSSRWLRGDVDAETFAFDADEPNATAFFLKASDLGTFLLFDPDGGYLVVEDGPLIRQTTLESDLTRLDDTYVSGAEWEFEPSESVSLALQLRHRRTGRLLGAEGLVDHVAQAAHLQLGAAEGCRAPEEMSLDATGNVTRTRFDDGELYGFADTHSHILSNFGFGGGGIFHGAAFHRLGVTHAMGSCEPFHGEDGRADILSAVTSGEANLETDSLIEFLGSGLLPEPVHATDGWPTFSEWPTVTSATHQTQYYRWLERAWMGGLRLMVQHAVSNEALCRILGETMFQPIRWSCRDMTNIDRQFIEIRNMERYIDAQAGGPGEGFFRIVTSPEEAREVIGAGKLAIVLGIEVPNLFECYVTPGEDDPECNRAHIEAQLDAYYERGLRVLFPTHKSDNAFTPGDGSRGIFEIANFMQTGHWSNFTDDCPDIPSSFDKGRVQFGGFNMPRADHLAPAPHAPIYPSRRPLREFLPFIDQVLSPALEGDWCQALGMTERGRELFEGIMARGILPELDHLPRRSYIEAFDMLEAANYPAVGTHGNTYNGRLFDIAGLGASSIQRCADPESPGSLFARFREEREERVAAGLHPSAGFNFDLNGLAGVPRPRFGSGSRCGDDQANPVTYPFTSFGGDVTFESPAIGDRAIDFNEEGMIHIGLVPELIEDARRTGASDADLEILFRSAEGYIRTWELAEERAAAFRSARE